MFKYYFYSLPLFILVMNLSASPKVNAANSEQGRIFTDTEKISKNDLLFDTLHLGKLGLGRRAYDCAMVGYNILKAKGKLTNPDILSIADMSTPSGKKRLFVLDVKNYKLLFATYVAHGKNTGLDKALFFSNDMESNKTSVGFYITSTTYAGKHGYSMRLEGLEIGFNNNAKQREIVMHSADYVEESVIRSQGYIGRSLGCPALSPAVNRSVIDKIKDGTCLFIYGNDGKYIGDSKLLKQKVELKEH